MWTVVGSTTPNGSGRPVPLIETSAPIRELFRSYPHAACVWAWLNHTQAACGYGVPTMPSRRSFLPVLCLSLAAATVQADSRPSKPHPDVARLPKAAAKLYADTTLFPRPTKWLTVPWLLDLNEGIRVATAEHRPVLLWVSGDDPLERC